MALQTINLDDRTFEEFVVILRKHIPPALWTDHNPSDPGVMLLELLCWIGEMTLYQMNRISDEHRQKFLNLLIDPPQPVAVNVTFTPTNLPLANDIVIPEGTRLATDFLNNHRFIFETLGAVRLTNPSGSSTGAATVQARELLAVTNEMLGTSAGRPNQVFQLHPPETLKTSPEQFFPVLLDFVNATATYQPNPQVSVAGAAWTLVPSLQTEASRVTGLNPAQHFMVEPFENRIRFGDDRFGAIPPAGASIVCTRYQILQGPAALISENQLHYVLDNVAGVPPGDFTIAHDDAEGGLHIFSPAVRIAEGLKDFRSAYRVVTDRDFEVVLMEDFNELQKLSNRTPKLVRAVAIMNRRPPLQSGLEAPGNVTLLALPEFDNTAFKDLNVPVSTKQSAVALSPPVRDKIIRFLDERRLITTHLHIVPPTLLPIGITAGVVIFKDRNTLQMEAALRERLLEFLNILEGDFDGRGWQLGRDVYRSQIFRVLEEVDGVDYIRLLSLTPSNAGGNVEVAPDQFPVLQNLTLTVERQ